MPGPSAPRRFWLPTLLYATFLASSWTWCIGMFLPGLLVREFGLWGWVVFAVPNVVGAAAMGFVLTRESSRWLVDRHAAACRMFSVVVIAYHAFWVAWLFPRLFGLTTLGLLVLATVILLTQRRRADWSTGVAVWVASAACFGAYLLTAEGPLLAPSPGAVEALGRLGLVHLVPLCVFGFALSPYLDLTFHRVCRAAPTPQRRWAFALGFGLFFTLMILFSLFYARVQFPPPVGGARLDDAGQPLWMSFVSLHMMAQTAFTVAVHWRELRRGQPRGDEEAGLAGVTAMAALAVGFPASGLLGLLPGAGETGYRLFLAFFGVIFPAYVWVCVVPRRHLDAGPDRRSLAVWAVALAVTAPMFWLGFIEERWAWLTPGVAVLLLAGPVAGWAARRTGSASGLAVNEDRGHEGRG